MLIWNTWITSSGSQTTKWKIRNQVKDKKCYPWTGVFLGQFELVYRASRLARGSWVAAGRGRWKNLHQQPQKKNFFLCGCWCIFFNAPFRRPLPRPKGELSRGSGGMLPRKNLKFDVAKTAVLCIFNAGSKSFFQASLKIDLILIICLKRSRKTNILMTLDKCDEPSQLV